MATRVVFMGTPEFAVPCLQALHDDGYEIVGVYTQPDRLSGRGRKIALSPVKQRALELGLPVFQPARLRDPEHLNLLLAQAPDVIVVVAYGQILSKEVLEIPEHGCINVHASLLPKYRGAAPIHRAIIDGETESGISIQLMDEGIDTGAVLAAVKLAIQPAETTGQLHDRLMLAGAELLCETINKWLTGSSVPEIQNSALATYAGKIDKKTEIIDWTLPATQVVNLVRGLNPAPGAHSTVGGRIIKIWQAAVTDIQFSGKPGEIVEVNSGGVFTACGSGCIQITELQMAGAAKMPVAAFVNAGKLHRGDVFE